MNERDRAQHQALRNQSVARERALAEMLRQCAVRDRWLRQRLSELQQRMRAVDGLTPGDVPAWPEIRIPEALAGLLEEED